MCETSISVWLVCKLCRGSFGQVEDFIEHKKQKHFTEFQKISCIVFEERDQGLLYPAETKMEHQPADEMNEPPIKIEVADDDPISPFKSEITDEPNSNLVEPKSELITFECEIIPDNENSFIGLKQPQPNPYVLLKRLTSDEIQRACDPQDHFRLLKFEQKDFVIKSEAPNVSGDVDSNVSALIKVEKPTENEASSTVTNISTEDDLQFECKLCSKQLESDAKLKIHVGICALYHEDRNRFCVSCNRKFATPQVLKNHRLSVHGTEEEKLSLYKFKCHVCPKKYQRAQDLRIHLKSHKKKKHKVRSTAPTSKLFKCLHPDCGNKFRLHTNLQRHTASVHLNVRPFRCHFPNCNKKFTTKGSMERHFRIHTGERPYKCPVDNCNQSFTFHSQISRHYPAAHRDDL